MYLTVANPMASAGRNWTETGNKELTMRIHVLKSDAAAVDDLEDDSDEKGPSAAHLGCPKVWFVNSLIREGHRQ
jgi:hypothetical protein